MKKIRVLYDYQAFTMQTHGGVSRCFVELYRHMPTHVQAQIAVKESNNVYIKDMQGVMPANYKYHNFISKHHFLGKGHLHLWYDKLTHGGYYPDYNQSYSIELLKKGDFDVFHPTFFSDYFLPYLNGKPFVLTIHDMIPELYPQYFARDDKQIVMKRKLASMASAIVTVSENTKKDVIRILDVPENKVHVVYHGCAFPKNGYIQLNHTNPYVLYVGDRSFRYKNFALFVRYMSPFLKKHPNLMVKCTGKPFTDEEIKMLQHYNVHRQFTHYWASTDIQLASLYHDALCFVFTSEYEGFGMPILEAYSSGCVALLNECGCFLEIAGNAAIYFRMTPICSNLEEKLEHVYYMSKKERDDLLRIQRNRLLRYSWEKSALQLANIYHSL